MSMKESFDGTGCWIRDDDRYSSSLFRCDSGGNGGGGTSPGVEAVVVGGAAAADAAGAMGEEEATVFEREPLVRSPPPAVRVRFFDEARLF